jgi:hypothetical protein
LIVVPSVNGGIGVIKGGLKANPLYYEWTQSVK